MSKWMGLETMTIRKKIILLIFFYLRAYEALFSRIFPYSSKLFDLFCKESKSTELLYKIGCQLKDNAPAPQNTAEIAIFF